MRLNSEPPVDGARPALDDRRGADTTQWFFHPAHH